MPKSVLVISTLDTKGQETLYLKDKLRAIGLAPILMDISGRGSDIAETDISAARVAAAGGGDFDEMQSSRDRTRITNIMMIGGSQIASELLAEGKLEGVIALGGSTGSLMGSEIMRALPFGIPKVMISSTAALPGLSTRYIGTGDIALFHSVVEISGVSDLLKNVMDRAAYALAGMLADDIASPKAKQGKAIALTMLGPCEKCASSVRAAMEQKGFQIIGFSAAGIGDRAMEDMIAGGFFQGVIDLAPGGVGEHHFGFMRDAGPNRMETAGKLGLPQIISTCSVNHMTPARSKYKPEYHDRRKFELDKLRTWIRLSPEELKEVAGIFAEKLNRSKGPVTVMIPQNGWSAADLPGNDTHDPAEDQQFTRVLRKQLKPDIQIIEVASNMEDPEFSAAVVENAVKIF
jgi:uncharacterized protein (UPF0261 family)